MPSPAKRGIDVMTIGLNSKGIDRFVQHDGVVKQHVLHWSP